MTNKKILSVVTLSLCLLVFLFFNNYQEVKLIIVATLDLSKDAIHIILGFLTFWCGIILLKLKPSSYKSLLPCLSLALMMEILDVRDDALSGMPPRWLASVHDILFTNLIPFIVVITCRNKRQGF